MRPQQQVVSGGEREPNIRLTEAAAAKHCLYFERGCKDPVRAFRQWAIRAGVPVKRVGRARIYESRTLDAFMDREPWTVRHAGGRRRLHVVSVRRAAQSSNTQKLDGSL